MNKILALDLGTSCGWCVTDGTVYDAGVLDLSSNRFEGGGMRYLRFRMKLRELIDRAGIQQIAYEEVPSHKGTAAAHAYGGFQAVLLEECEMQQLPCEAVPIATIKKFATGKGGGKGSGKEAMVAAARKVWPHAEIVDHNQADAMHMARLVASRNGGAS